MADPMTLTRRAILFSPVVLAACRRGAAIIELTGSTMGTTYSIVAVDRSRSLKKSDVQSAVDRVLGQVNAQMSNWDAGSEISRFNSFESTEAVAVSPELANVMKAAQDVHAASGGQFDISLGPLIELWGFGAAGTAPNMPRQSDIDAALDRSGHIAGMRIEGSTIRKSNPGAQVYLSAIGKGHGVDLVARELRSRGIEDYLVEIGGDLVSAGRNALGEPWRIGIERPDAYSGVQRIVGLSDAGMATSGDYRNYFEKNGVRYSHILDAKTGRPVTHETTSATVLTENAMLADAWATAMLIVGRQRGMEIAEELDLAALFVERDVDGGTRYTVTASPRFAALTG